MQDKKVVFIQTLVTSFQKALRLLIPIADELEMHWKEPNNYDEWDAIASGLFEGIVLVGVRSSNEWSPDGLPLMRYDERSGDYSLHSYVAAQWDNQIHPLICLETTSIPFDSCLLAKIDGSGKLLGTIQAPLDECKFSAVIKTISGIVEVDSLSF